MNAKKYRGVYYQKIAADTGINALYVGKYASGKKVYPKAKKVLDEYFGVLNTKAPKRKYTRHTKQAQPNWIELYKNSFAKMTSSYLNPSVDESKKPIFTFACGVGSAGNGTVTSDESKCVYAISVEEALIKLREYEELPFSGIAKKIEVYKCSFNGQIAKFKRYAGFFQKEVEVKEYCYDIEYKITYI